MRVEMVVLGNEKISLPHEMPLTSFVVDKKQFTSDANGSQVVMLPVVILPKPGDASHGAKILSEKWQGNTYTAVVEGLKGTENNTFRIYSATAPKRVDGAKQVGTTENVSTLQVGLPAAKEKYSTQMVTIIFYEPIFKCIRYEQKLVEDLCFSVSDQQR